MSRFAGALSQALHDLGESQTAFAGRSGIDVRQLNKYVRGKLDIGPANIQTVARQLPEPHRANVVAAWLRDMIPEIASGSVSVETPTRIAERPNESLGDLGPELDTAVRYLIAQACHHTEISDLMIDLARALRGR